MTTLESEGRDRVHSDYESLDGEESFRGGRGRTESSMLRGLNAWVIHADSIELTAAALANDGEVEVLRGAYLGCPVAVKRVVSGDADAEFYTGRFLQVQNCLTVLFAV